MDNKPITLVICYYERLLNVEFMWNIDSLPDLNPKIGLPHYITEELISKAIAKMPLQKLVKKQDHLE